jgi:manganese/iron transport system permease protein
VNLILDPLGYEFFPRALLAAVLVMLLGALAGPGVRARRQVYLGQGVSQSMLVGVAAAAVGGASGVMAAALAACAAAAFVTLLSRRMETDVAIATVSGLLLSLGVTVLSVRRDRAVNVSNLLFGNVLGVSWGDVVALAAVAVLTGGFFVLSARRLALLGVSREVARAHGVRVGTLEAAQTVAVSVAVAAFVQVAGTLLAVSALVLPTAVAHVLCRSVRGVHTVGAMVAVAAATVGLYASYWWDIPSGPAITITATLILLAVLALPRRGHLRGVRDDHRPTGSDRFDDPA